MYNGKTSRQTARNWKLLGVSSTTTRKKNLDQSQEPIAAPTQSQRPNVEDVHVYFSRPQFAILKARQQINLFLAGQGSGKTYIAGIITATLIIEFPKHHGFIGANTYKQLTGSTFFRIRAVWKTIYDWTEWSPSNPQGTYIVNKQPPPHFNTTGHQYNDYGGLICFKWGTVIYMGSLDNYKALDGLEFGWAILDETKDTKEEAVKEVIVGRLREKGMFIDTQGNLTENNTGTPFNPLYIFTTPAKVPWINEWFKLEQFQNEIVRTIYAKESFFQKKVDNKFVVISSTYHNAANLPANYIENQEKNLSTSLVDILVYGNPFSQSGGEFYKCFSRTRHTTDLTRTTGFEGAKPYNPKIALHISFDFNVHPYMTCTIWQIIGKSVFQIDEICSESPKNTTDHVCQEFIRRYPTHDAGLFIYGDPAGRHEDTRSEKGVNDYVIIRRALSQYNPSQRIPTAAPPVSTRGNFINSIFEKEYEEIKILIDDRCAHSIADFNYIKEASDGTKLKEKDKNPQTGVTFEKYGHTSDSADYFLCSAFSSEFAKFKSGGILQKAPKYGRTIGKNTY